MLTLADNPQELLANLAYGKYKEQGYTSRPYALTWLEFNNLAGFFLKLSREKQLDPQSFDFSTLIDFNGNYEENRSILIEAIGNPYSETEKEATSKLGDYLTEEKVKEYTDKERSVIEEIQSDHQTLTKKLGQITKTLKAQENQTIDPEALKHELEEMNRVQTLIYAKLEQLPNLEVQIAALLKSNNFKDLGKALQPIKPTVKEPDPEKPQPKTPVKLSKLATKFSTWLKTKHIKFLDALAGAVTTGIWLATSGWIIQSFSLTYASGIGLGVFWLCYIVVFRLMIGGILD